MADRLNVGVTESDRAEGERTVANGRRTTTMHKGIIIDDGSNRIIWDVTDGDGPIDSLWDAFVVGRKTTNSPLLIVWRALSLHGPLL